MRPNIFRTVLLLWFLCVGAAVLWPLFHGWAGWPAPAQVYAQWMLYQTEVPPLLWQFELILVGQVLLILSGIALWFDFAPARYVFLLGLLFQLYGHYSTVPTISSGAEIIIESLYYLISGCVVIGSFVYSLTASKKE